MVYTVEEEGRKKVEKVTHPARGGGNSIEKKENLFVTRDSHNHNKSDGPIKLLTKQNLLEFIKKRLTI